MLQTTEPVKPPVVEELEMIVNRLSNLRTNLANLGDEFGINLDHPEHPHADVDRVVPGLDRLRLNITEINTQIAYLEQESERLFAARVQLFGLGDDSKWSDVTLPPGHGPIQSGNFRSHP